MLKVVVGCPVAGRLWVFPRWIDHTLRACEEAGVLPEFAFVLPYSDGELVDVISEKLEARDVSLVFTDEDPRRARRDWNDMRRLHQMVALRNQLLRRVRELQPELFWSLDSDMLARPDALNRAIDCLQDPSWGAVGMRTFMQPAGTAIASKANLVNGRLVSREDVPWTHEVDVIMGAKLLTPLAYETDYEFHPKGEDVGWSCAARRRGLRLAWCADANVKHVMEPKYLDEIDERVGF